MNVLNKSSTPTQALPQDCHSIMLKYVVQSTTGSKVLSMKTHDAQSENVSPAVVLRHGAQSGMYASLAVVLRHATAYVKACTVPKGNYFTAFYQQQCDEQQAFGGGLHTLLQCLQCLLKVLVSQQPLLKRILGI